MIWPIWFKRWKWWRSLAVTATFWICLAVVPKRVSRAHGGQNSNANSREQIAGWFHPRPSSSSLTGLRSPCTFRAGFRAATVPFQAQQAYFLYNLDPFVRISPGTLGVFLKTGGYRAFSTSLGKSPGSPLPFLHDLSAPLAGIALIQFITLD